VKQAPRRTTGTGSVFYEAARGRWKGEIRVTAADGSTKLTAVTLTAPNNAATRRAAEKKLEARKRETAGNGGQPVATSAMTVATYLEDWTTGARRPSTVALHRWAVRKHLAPRLDKVKLARIGKGDVDRLVADLLASGLKPNSVRLIRATLGVALGDAVRTGIIVRNPVDVAERLVVAGSAVVDDVLSADDACHLLAAARGDRLEALGAVLLGTGLRKGEALALRWSDVDLTTGTVRVERTLQRLAGRLMFGPPKTRSSVRTVTAPAFVVEALRRHRATQREEKLALGPDWAEVDLVFTTIVGTPVDPRNCQRWWDRMCKRAGIGKRRPHAARHSTATAALAAGMPVTEVSAMLGHSNSATTLKVYAHATADGGAKVAAALDEWLRSASGGAGS
jgi:integrase